MKVVLVGKPNSGKSSLFNKFVTRAGFSVVSPEPGVTKDWRVVVSRYGWEVVDTPGFEDFNEPFWWNDVSEDLHLWIIDASTSITDLDHRIARLLKKRNTIICFNKCDIVSEVHTQNWGFESVELSARTGVGIMDLVDRISLICDVIVEPKPCNYMVIGQPNAGKSSLINVLASKNRVLVSDTPGTTVDFVDVDCPIGIVRDTPGIKRRKYDGFMSDAVKNAVYRIREFKGVLLMVIDASQMSVSQDLRLASLAWSTGNPVLCLLNKCDLMRGSISREWVKTIYKAAPTLQLMQVSTKTMLNISKISSKAQILADRWSARIGTGALNRWCSNVVMPHHSTIKYIAQVDTSPPKLFIAGKKLGESEKRFIARKFRTGFKFDSVPIQIENDIY